MGSKYFKGLWRNSNAKDLVFSMTKILKFFTVDNSKTMSIMAGVKLKDTKVNSKTA